MSHPTCCMVGDDSLYRRTPPSFCRRQDTEDSLSRVSCLSPLSKNFEAISNGWEPAVGGWKFLNRIHRAQRLRLLGERRMNILIILEYFRKDESILTVDLPPDVSIDWQAERTGPGMS